MEELVNIIDEALSAKSRDDWGEIFDEAGLIWGPVLALHEVVADPQAQALGMFPTLQSPDVGEYATVANPMKFKTAEVAPTRSHPNLGEHTSSYLRDLGLSIEEIDELKAQGVVGSAEI